LNLHDIIRFSEAQPVNVTMATFTELMSLDRPLALDGYQRPYVWGAEKVTQLVADLKTVLEPIANAAGRTYYMGALLLHWDVRNHRQAGADHRLRAIFVPVVMMTGAGVDAATGISGWLCAGSHRSTRAAAPARYCRVGMPPMDRFRKSPRMR